MATVELRLVMAAFFGSCSVQLSSVRCCHAGIDAFPLPCFSSLSVLTPLVLPFSRSSVPPWPRRCVWRHLARRSSFWPRARRMCWATRVNASASWLRSCRSASTIPMVPSSSTPRRLVDFWSEVIFGFYSWWYCLGHWIFCRYPAWVKKIFNWYLYTTLSW